MSAGLEQCLSFINCQLQPPLRFHAFEERAKCAITISRQSGCGAHVIAQMVATQLQSRTPPEAASWTIFDRDLVERALAEHQLPERLARFMPEDRVLGFNDMMDEIFGLHPPSWTLVQQISETILKLAALGNVIILGRGGNIITSRLPHVLHVRLIGSLERRIENMRRFEKLGRVEAINRIRHEDVGRERYVRKHFHRDINDPLLYHLVINTDLFSECDAARLIGDLALQRMRVPVS